MKPFVVKPISRLEGEISLPGDKSIAHRCIIISSICSGKTRIENFPANKDCLSTINAFKKLGIKIIQESHKLKKNITVTGVGLYGLTKPKGSIFTGDSGTTLRLLLGVLAGQDFKAKLISGKSLSSRPMLRVTAPLRLMGAKICARRNAKQEEYPPIVIKGGVLKAITYRVPVASAQVKSAILLAALYAKGKTRIIEPIGTRDHTERLLKLFKADIKVVHNTIFIKGGKELVSARLVTIPGDISSAAFFMVLTAIIPDSSLLIRNISLNPSRIGIIRILKRMGVHIRIRHQASGIRLSEPAGDISVKSSKLKGVVIKREEIPSLIDELPVLMVAACFAKGRTVFEGVGELRVKETDRISSMTVNLKKLGADIRISKNAGSESIIVIGGKPLRGAKVNSFGDHRTAMSMIVAGLAARGITSIDDISCIDKSFPGFVQILNTLNKQII